MYKFTAQHTQLGWIFHLKSEIPIMGGYAQDRHRLISYWMLLKKLISQDVTYIRTICLLYLEVNNNYKQHKRYAMRASIKHGHIYLDKYFQPRRNAMAHEVKIILVFDYQIYIRWTFNLAYSDLKSCYDRIVHNTASIALQHLGLPILEIFSMLEVIQKILRKVITSFGD